jgi:hypothetical protein
MAYVPFGSVTVCPRFNLGDVRYPKRTGSDRADRNATDRNNKMLIPIFPFILHPERLFGQLKCYGRRVESL